MNTRIYWRFAAVLLLVAAIGLTGCRRRESPAPAQTPASSGGFSLAEAARPYQGQTVRMIGEAMPPLDALIELKGRFEKESGIHVEVEPLGYDLMTERVTLDVTSKTGRYDLILQAPEGWGKLAARGELYPIEDFRSNPKLRDPSFDPRAQLFEKPWRDLGWFGDKVYGYPFSVLTMNVWYRKDLLSDPNEQVAFRNRYGYELGVPRDWKQYRDVAEFFTRPAKGLYGTLVQGKRHPALWQEWLNFSYSFGGGTIRKANAWEYGPIVVNSPESVEATEFYKGLIAFSPPGTLEYTWDDALAAMQQGKVVLAIMWTDMSAAVEDPKASTVAGRIGYSSLPAGRAGKVAQISGYSYLIPKTAKHPEAAYLFIQWMLRPEVQVEYQKLGGQSGYKSVYQDPEVQKIPYAAGVYDSLQYATSMRETIPEAGVLAESIQTGLSDILRGQKTPRKGLDWIAVQMKKALGDKAALEYPVSGGNQ